MILISTRSCGREISCFQSWSCASIILLFWIVIRAKLYGAYVTLESDQAQPKRFEQFLGFKFQCFHTFAFRFDDDHTKQQKEFDNTMNPSQSKPPITISRDLFGEESQALESDEDPPSKTWVGMAVAWSRAVDILVAESNSRRQTWSIEQCSYDEFMTGSHWSLLGSVNIENDEAIQIAGALQDWQCRVAILCLRRNNIGVNGGIGLAKTLRGTVYLTTLDLSQNNLGEEGSKAMADALVFNKTLEKLDLSRNKIGDSGAQDMANALHVNVGLTSLNLAGNGIRDEGAKKLARSLRFNKHLETLQLCSNQITLSGGKALVKAVPFNRIFYLSLKRNKITRSGAKELKHENEFSVGRVASHLTMCETMDEINLVDLMCLMKYKCKLAARPKNRIRHPPYW